MMKLATRAVAALALSACALSAAAQGYPNVPGPGGSMIAPQPTTLVGMDALSGKPCVVGTSLTCQLPVPVSTGSGSGGGGAVTAAAGAYADGALFTLGQEADSVCASDVGSCSAEALFKRGNQRLSALISAIGSPMQAGGSIANTAFGLTGNGNTAYVTSGHALQVDATATTQPVSTAAGAQVDIGTGSSPGATTVNGRLATINSTLGAPFQAGGSIGNTSFGLTGGGNTATVTSAGALKVDGSAVNQPTTDANSGAILSAAQTTATAQGAAQTGSGAPTNPGTGVLGWLGGIYKAVTGTLSVSGSVSVSNLPTTQPVSGSVSVSNLPTIQPVSGTVTANQGGAWSDTVTNTGFNAVGTGGGPLANDAADGGVLTSDDMAPAAAISASGATYSGGVASFSAASQTVVLDVRHYGSAALMAQGAGLGSIGVYCSNSASGPWIAAAGTTANNVGSFQSGNAINANSQWVFNTCGRYLELASTSWGSGTTTVGVALQRDPRPLPSIYAQLAGGGAQLQPTSSASYAIVEAAQQGSSGYAFKTSAGNLYGWDVDEGGTAGYFCFLDAAALPAASATITPKFCITAAANSTTHVRQDLPDRFATGIVIVSTSSVTTYTAVASAILSAAYQ